MLNLDSLDGFCCYKNLIIILLIEKGQRTPRLENILDDPQPINDSFPDEQLVAINVSNSTPWYVDYANYIVAKYIPLALHTNKRKKFLYDLRFYFWDDPHLYKEGVDGIIRHCVPEHIQVQILWKCNSKSYGGHHAGDRTAHKVLQSWFYWPTLQGCA